MAGIYIHIPFCKKACTYCNFHFSTTLRGKDELLQAIVKEMSLQKEYLQDEKIRTVYFGGGTPSLLSADELKRIFDALEATFDLSEIEECTLEANPDDINHHYLKDLRSTPVNRFSLGVQSFHEADLRYMHRAHTAQQSEYAIKAAQDAGFTNLSIDLIYGTPGLSNDLWQENIARLEALEIPHFSAYALTVEEGTALHHAIEKKKMTPVDAEQSAEQFQMLMKAAPGNGFEHYEISNFAKPGQYAVHNTSYWQGVHYLGLGPSAHSFTGEKRQWNVANNALYTHSIMSQNAVPFESETLTDEQRLNEYIMTSLRTMWGTDLKKITEGWGTDRTNNILKGSTRYIDDGKMIFKDEKLFLTNDGKLFADAIAANLFQ